MFNFLDFWQKIPYKIDPIIFQISIFSFRWYWLMYLVAFTFSYFILKNLLKKEKVKQIEQKKLLDGLFWVFLGVLIGARIGFFLFYNPTTLFSDPLSIFNPFGREEGKIILKGFYGMSFHGGLIGGGLAFFWYAKKFQLQIWRSLDLIILSFPLGYTFGRLGNFFNGELWGRITQSPIGMYFPQAVNFDFWQLGITTPSLRHPSQLYEAFFEGLITFILLRIIYKKYKEQKGFYFSYSSWFFFVKNKFYYLVKLFKKQKCKVNLLKIQKKKPTYLQIKSGFFVALYLILYGFFRFLIEFFREPDYEIGLFANLSLGQWLCLIMIISGGWLMFIKSKLITK